MVLGQETFKDVVVKTSHNSYALGNLQIGAQASAQAIVNALNKKARAIEIDVFYDNPTQKLVIAHGTNNEGVGGKIMGAVGSVVNRFKGEKAPNNTYFTNTLDVNEALIAIKDNAFITSELPLVLFIDIGWKREQKEHFKAFGEMLKKNLGDLILNCDDFSFDKPVITYKNKIICIPSVSVAQVEEFDYCACWGCYREPFQNCSRPDYDKKKENLTLSSITRVYPHNVLGSGNFDPLPLLCNGITFVALDFNIADTSEVDKLDKVFVNEGIVPIVEARTILGIQ